MINMIKRIDNNKNHVKHVNPVKKWMLQNPLIQRYRFSLLRPKQVGVYSFIYLAIVIMILLLNYTAFTTFSLFLTLESSFPFNIYTFIFYQFALFQIIILWGWASYNSGSALTVEILRKSYIFFKLLPVTALQKALGVLIGTNLVAYSFAALNFIPLFIFAYLGEMNAIQVGYYFLLTIAIACFLNCLTLLLSINPDAKKKRRLGTLFIIVASLWGLMLAMGTLFVRGRPTPNIEEIFVGFFALKLPGFPLFAFILFYFTGWMLLGIMRKFRYEKEALFNKTGAMLFFIGCEVLSVGLFWSFFPLKTGFYSHSILCFWALVFINTGTLKRVEKYYEFARKIQTHSPAKILNTFRLLQHSTLFWGICLFGIWTAFFLGLTMKAGLLFTDISYPLLNLFGFYLFFIVLLEVFVLHKPAHVNIKVFLLVVALLSLLLPLSLSEIFDNKLIYLHSVFGYISSLMVPFLFQGGNAAVQLRIFVVNLLLCLLPLFFILRKYQNFLRLSG